MAKKKVDYSSKKLLATVSGMKIYSGSVYIVTGKMDEGAPSGFQERGISKVPFPGNKTISQCSWDKNLHVYDTGFFVNSICYEGWPREERESEVKMRVENIKNPYESATGEDLSQQNFDFWDNATVDNYDGRLFYTDDVHDLFDLYISLQSKALTPKEEDGNPEFQSSLYCVEDKTTAIDIRKQRQMDKTDIIYNFVSMITGDPKEQQEIKDLLLYLDIIHSTDIDKDMIKYVFTNWLENKNTNIDAYKDAYERFIEGDEDAKDVIAYHRVLKELAYRGKVTIGSNGVMFGADSIGADFISAAMSLVSNKDLMEVKTRLYESYLAMKDEQDKILKAGNSK